MRSRCCLCVCVRLCIPLIVARQRLGESPLIVARQRLGKNPSIVARQWLGRNVTAVTNTHATIEELLVASFSLWPVSYQWKKAICSSQNFLFINHLNSILPSTSRSVKWWFLFRYISLSPCAQTGSVAYPASHQMVPWALPRGKSDRTWSWPLTSI
jgi:hypothetical protein